MFRFKKKSEDDVLSAALLKGIAEARTAQAHEKGELQKAYNKASGVLKGLSSLRDLPDSKFEFKILEKDKFIEIETNIPTSGRSFSYGRDRVHSSVDKVTIAVESNGRIKVYGDTRFTGVVMGWRSYSAQEISSRRRNATGKALTFVSKKAQEKGLLP